MKGHTYPKLPPVQDTFHRDNIHAHKTRDALFCSIRRRLRAFSGTDAQLLEYAQSDINNPLYTKELCEHWQLFKETWERTYDFVLDASVELHLSRAELQRRCEARKGNKERAQQEIVLRGTRHERKIKLDEKVEPRLAALDDVKPGRLEIHAKILYRLSDGRFVHKDFSAPVVNDWAGIEFDETMMELCVRKVMQRVKEEQAAPVRANCRCVPTGTQISFGKQKPVKIFKLAGGKTVRIKPTTKKQKKTTREDWERSRDLSRMR